MDVTVIVATYGDRQWIDTAFDIAIPSAERLLMSNPFPFNIITLHGETLHGTRNEAAGLADSEWLCFLDADDELDENYLIEMERASKDGELLAPRLFFKSKGGVSEPFDLTQRNILRENPCPIGTLVLKDMFEAVGGFWDEPIYEDWSLFRRLHLIGGNIVHTNAKYYANNLGGRNESSLNPGLEIKKIIDSHDRWMRR